VQAAVRFAREHELEIAVRGGGHNVAGNAVRRRALIDLSAMRGVHADPRARRYAPRAGPPGATNRETQLHGLASTGGVVLHHRGRLTLGGGLGWLMGKHGMAWTACGRWSS
jgi:FAD/FMN-containing dehydrogenase